MPPAVSPAADQAPTHKPPRGSAPTRALPPRRWLVALFILLMVCAAVVFRATVATPVRISSSSMLPTLAGGDVVLVSKDAPALDDLRRGDLVAFWSPEDGQRTIKRVIGLPGDSLVIRDSRLFVNGRAVAEPYVDHAAIDGYYSRTYDVPAGTVFVLGDNRGNSIDSRDYGPVGADAL